MSAVPEEERFATNVNIMIQAIQESVIRVNEQGIKTVSPELISTVASVILLFDKHFLIQGFIENSHERCWDCIRERNEAFFLENAGEIFKYLPAEKINLFRDLYIAKDKQGNNVVSQGLKDQIWGLFDAMIKISIKYIHRNRSPYSTSTDQGVIRSYGATFFPEVDLQYHASVWRVDLPFPPQF